MSRETLNPASIDIGQKRHRKEKIFGGICSKAILISITNRSTGSPILRGLLVRPLNTSFREGANEHMGDSRHIELLKQGTKVWNKMRRSAHSKERPDLSGADLRGIKLEEVKLEGVNLEGADLEGAELIGANLNFANLVAANLTGATLVSAYLIRTNLREADLTRAILMTADLSAANLHRAILRGADLSFLSLTDADLSETDLTEADLCGTNLSRSDLSEADLSSAKAGQTIFGDLDLSEVKGLHTIKHYAPSTLGIDTILRSRGNLPDVFFRGVGVPDDLLIQMRTLTQNPLGYFTCFISFSNKERRFAEKLNADLRRQGVRCWFAPEDMRIGDKIRDTIDKTIRGYDKLLLILSRHSIDSDWVEKEVETAFEEERRRRTTVLFPVRVDQNVMSCNRAWAADIRRTRHIGDFTGWEDVGLYQDALSRLLRDLKGSTKSSQVA